MRRASNRDIIYLPPRRTTRARFIAPAALLLCGAAVHHVTIDLMDWHGDTKDARSILDDEARSIDDRVDALVISLLDARASQSLWIKHAARDDELGKQARYALSAMPKGR
jgi:hypothetical protein